MSFFGLSILDSWISEGVRGYSALWRWHKCINPEKTQAILVHVPECPLGPLDSSEHCCGQWESPVWFVVNDSSQHQSDSVLRVFV